MKEFLKDLLPRFERFRRDLDDITLIKKKHWVLLNKDNGGKQTYIFRPNGELLISNSGLVNRSKWEYIGNKSLLIDVEGQTFMFSHGILNEGFLVLEINKENLLVFINDEIYQNYEQAISLLQSEFSVNKIEANSSEKNEKSRSKNNNSTNLKPKNHPKETSKLNEKQSNSLDNRTKPKSNKNEELKKGSYLKSKENNPMKEQDVSSSTIKDEESSINYFAVAAIITTLIVIGLLILSLKVNLR